MTPGVLRAAIASARKRPNLYASDTGDLETYLCGLVTGAAPDKWDVRVVWRENAPAPLIPGGFVYPDSTWDSVCDHALRVVDTLWPQGDEASRGASTGRRCPECGGEWRDNPTETCPECAVRFESVEAPAPPLDLDAIEARATAAFPPPWRAGVMESEGKVWAHDPEALGGPSVGERCVFTANKHFPHTANREFIAHARTDVPALVAEVRRLRAQRIADLAEHVGASARWGDRKVGLLARVVELEAAEKALRAEVDEADARAGRFAELLRATADALKGPPQPLALHSWHDLPEVAAALRAEVERERAMRLGYESAISFETACVGCAKQLDGHLALQERAEKAEAEAARLRAEVDALKAPITRRIAPSVAVDVDDDGDLVVVTRSEAEAFAAAHPYAAGAIMGGIAKIEVTSGSE